MIVKILIRLVSVVALFLVCAAFRPAHFHVQRTAALDASPAVLFAQVNDHHKFSAWNPFLKLDPNVKNTYSGPDSGVEAVCSWEGNSDIGAGSSTITESQPNERIRMRMDWKRPMEGVATVDFLGGAEAVGLLPRFAPIVDGDEGCFLEGSVAVEKQEIGTVAVA